MSRSKEFIAESQVMLQMKEAQEKKKRNGLIILEAYFGKLQHVKDIAEELTKFIWPQNMREYEVCQVIIIRRQLQLVVENSQLDLERDFHKKVRGLFLPCLKKTDKTGLFIKFKVGSLKKEFFVEI